MKKPKSMKKYLNLADMILFASLVFCCSCGSTRVSVEKPSQGTQTTITVTTNNPITTNVNPNTNANLNLKGEEK